MAPLIQTLHQVVFHLIEPQIVWMLETGSGPSRMETIAKKVNRP